MSTPYFGVKHRIAEGSYPQFQADGALTARLAGARV
jgi:hypothetical protein